MRREYLSAQLWTIIAAAIALALLMAPAECGARLGVSYYDVDVELKLGEALTLPVMRVLNVGDEGMDVAISTEAPRGLKVTLREANISIAPDDSHLIEVEVKGLKAGAYVFYVEVSVTAEGAVGSQVLPGAHHGCRVEVLEEGPLARDRAVLGVGSGFAILAIVGWALGYRKRRGEEDGCGDAGST